MQTPARVTIAITGMHCAACEGRVAAAIKTIPGVTNVHVSRTASTDAAGPHATVVSDREISLESLRHAVRSASDQGRSYGVIEPHTAPTAAQTATDGEPDNESLYPLFLIVSFIVGVVAIVGLRRLAWSWHESMLDFMAGFFVVFSFFKFLDLRGFVFAYRMYDLIAARSRGYAFVYPFLELALGVAYLTRFQLAITNAVTLVVMVVGTLGVGRAVLNRSRIRCACLGTALNLPMTTVTIVEDVGMALMAAAMLLWPVLS
ncbi:MAG: heavy-metal-associated domain-containing protein [Phycisphaerales bacterium]|nr:MAG: heavy-metal-associated domain-containing protein [Phycisphaerales bacterium]